MKKTILIDLDGVLNEYNGNYRENFIPKAAKGVNDFLKILSKDYNIVIFTTRNNALATNWLKENSLDKYVSEITNIKRPCLLYIDDRALCYKGNFSSTIEEIKKFNTHWEHS